MNTDWQQDAACTPQDLHLFFGPDDHEPAETRQRRERQARAICAECPVRRPCLDAGMETRFGTWGGLTEQDRHQLRRRRQAKRRALGEERAA